MTVVPSSFDLRYDSNSVGADLVAETWISHGPRAADPSFNPKVGDSVVDGDEEEPDLNAVVVHRDGNRVWIRLSLPVPSFE
jgi:hypothetical protein